MREVTEENILKAIIEKESWEEILYYIVSVENLDPWDVDLVKLTESFIKFIKKAKELDFRIPAKVVFVAAILLRLKAQYLSIFEEEKKGRTKKREQPVEELGINPDLIKLSPPVKRIPKRAITLSELINALRKALEVKEKRERRKKLLKERISNIVEIEREDITKLLEETMKRIVEKIEKDKKEWIPFKEIVEEWRRDAIVRRFLPILYLEQEGKIRTFQEDFFKEIYVSKSKNFKNKS